MNYAVVLAGGVGKRMANIKLPKQFMEICSIPIIILTLKNIIKTGLFEKIIVAIHPNWIDYLKELLFHYEIDETNIVIISGGKERIDSIENALDNIKNYASNEDIIVFCDAVRPFINEKILKNAVIETQKHFATVAICPVKDTMIISKNGVAFDMPDRSTLFHGQAPDSFKFEVIYKSLKSLTKEERLKITGTAQICKIKGIPIHTFEGDEKNIKITTSLDLFLAKAIYEEVRE